MASESNSGVLEECTPNVDIHVTTDVCLTKHDCEPSDNSEGTKITIVTDLNAVINKKNNTNKYNFEQGGGESCFNISEDLLVLDYSFNQPAIRKSKKCTQLNVKQNTEPFKASERFEINRTVLLPYLGCTNNRKEPHKRRYKKEAIVKSSKSWETVGKPCESTRNESAYRCKSLHKTSPALIHFPNEPFQNLNGTDLLPQPSDNFDVTSSKYGSDSLSYTSMYINNGALTSNMLNNKPSFYMPESIKKKTNAYENINCFDKEVIKLHAPVFPLKATRNVSILHRPRTREKATSTTSLNKENFLQQNVKNSMKGMVMPYGGMTMGKDFPSEIVLKLTTKKDIIDSKKDKGNLIGVRTYESRPSVGSSLLVPITGPRVQKRKNKKFGIFSKCLSSKDKSTNAKSKNNCEDWEQIEKEVYYPSIVEVHTNKQMRRNDNQYLHK